MVGLSKSQCPPGLLFFFPARDLKTVTHVSFHVSFPGRHRYHTCLLPVSSFPRIYHLPGVYSDTETEELCPYSECMTGLGSRAITMYSFQVWNQGSLQIEASACVGGLLASPSCPWSPLLPGQPQLLHGHHLRFSPFHSPCCSCARMHTNRTPGTSAIPGSICDMWKMNLQTCLHQSNKSCHLAFGGPGRC